MDLWRPEPLPLFETPEWARVVGVFDLETTGVDVASDRIVSAHVGILDVAGGVLQARDWLADPGVEIPEGATAVHGITTARARAEGRPCGEVVAEVVEALSALFAAGIPVVAYNAPYDFSLLKYEALRHGVAPIASPSPVIDPLVMDKRYDRYRRGKRTLSVVAAHYAVRLDSAHDACADAVAAGRVAQALAERFAAELPPTLDELHTQQIGWARAGREPDGVLREDRADRSRRHPRRQLADPLTGGALRAPLSSAGRRAGPRRTLGRRRKDVPMSENTIPSRDADDARADDAAPTDAISDEVKEDAAEAEEGTDLDDEDLHAGA